MHDDSNQQADRSYGGSVVGQGGQGVVGYALVAVAFVVVLVLVLTTLGDSIGEGARQPAGNHLSAICELAAWNQRETNTNRSSICGA